MMKRTMILAATLALAGCATMDQQQSESFRNGFMGALSIGAAQEQQRNYQIQQQQMRRPLSCTTRYVGANAHTDCW